MQKKSRRTKGPGTWRVLNKCVLNSKLNINLITESSSRMVWVSGGTFSENKHGVNSWYVWCILSCLPKCFHGLLNWIFAARKGTRAGLGNCFHFAAEKTEVQRGDLADGHSMSVGVM